MHAIWSIRSLMTNSRVSLAFFTSAAVLLSILTATPTLAAQQAAAKVEVPDVVGEPFNLVYDALKTLELKPKTDRVVIVKSNWIVVSQKPAGGTLVASGAKITLKVIKMSEVVKEGTALGYCRGMAKTDPTILYGIEFPSGQWVSTKRDLGWAIDVSVLTGTSTGGRSPMRVYCEIEGTNKEPKMLNYKLTER